MRNLTIWQRLNLAMGLLILLLLIGGGFAIWMERANSSNRLEAERLEHVRDRVVADLKAYSTASASTLLDPGGDADAKAREFLDSALTQSLEQARTQARTHPGLAPTLKRLDALKSDLKKFTAQMPAPRNSEAALAYYTTNFPPLRELQTDVIGDLEGAVSDATQKMSDSATRIAKVALAGIVVVLFMAIAVGRFQSRSVTAPMVTIVAALERMQQGDFTGRVQMERRDEFGAVGRSLNKLADELSILVGQVQRSGIQVNSTATEIAGTAREQQSTVNEIAATTAEIGATSKEISATSKELVKTMNEVTAVSEETADLAGSGQSAIGKMESTMRQIMEASGSITSKLAVLNEKTANINTVVTTITKVADQTNLLSLNAAIEAEKAGEYGLGFAVVAMEIRRLADQTAVATYDIEKMVKEMQSAVSAGVMGMDKFSEEVRRGVEEVRQVGGQLAQIIHQVQTLTPRFHTVNEGMNAQATGAQQISETLTQLNEAAQLTAESLRQSNAAIDQLNDAARGLQAGVARFKLKAG
jgi:methyl-accepting chemotaxis protein WspA